MCAKLQAFVEKYHPDTVNRAVNIFKDNVMSLLRKIVQKRKKQRTMDRFLIKEKKATAKPDSPPKKRDIREKTLKKSYPASFGLLMLFRCTFS